MTQQPTTWAHISGYRFLLRRLERALLRGQTGASGEPLRSGTAPLTIGGVLALITAAG
ncbi:type VII secretion protein EccB, partial [Mycobacterium simiae]